MKSLDRLIRSLMLIILFLIILLVFCIKSHADGYKTPSWQRRAIDNYNYNQAVSGKGSETLDSGYSRTPSWQRRAIDNYNYNKAVSGKQREKREKDDY